MEFHLIMQRKTRTPHKARKLRHTLQRPKRKLQRNVGTASAPACAPAALASVDLTAWQLTGAAITGLSHWHKHLPCQDAVRWGQHPRPVLVLSDGAGSAAVSELGAQALTQGMLRFVISMEDEVAQWLDADHTDAQLQTLSDVWRQRLLCHAQGLLQDLAAQQRRSIQDVRATLQIAVLGQKHCYWWQVGDGSTVMQTINNDTPSLHVLGNSRHAKGEFANQTCFVDTVQLSDVQCGHVPTHSTHGWALMSDGGAEKLVAHNGGQVAARLHQWLSSTAAQKLPPEQLALAYHERAMWERTTLDDRAIVLAARSVSQTS